MRVWELEKSTSFSPESPLKKNLGTAALHGPIAEAKLQTSSAWSSTRFHEVENIRKICKQTITWMDFRFDKLIIFFLCCSIFFLCQCVKSNQSIFEYWSVRKQSFDICIILDGAKNWTFLLYIAEKIKVYAWAPQTLTTDKNSFKNCVCFEMIVWFLLQNLQMMHTTHIYRKVTSSNTSRLEAHGGFSDYVLINGIFYHYVLWPFDKKMIS